MSFFPIRKTDLGLILTALISMTTLIGAMYMGFGKPASWDTCVKDMATIKPTVIDHITQIAVMKQEENDHFVAIMNELHAINKKVGR